jgi:AraC family transcriptional regulator
MAECPTPDIRTIESITLVGKMAIYNSQAAASAGIPEQWRAFLLAHPTLESSAHFYGASPCTNDHKIHYLSGVHHQPTDPTPDGERLTLEAGEYAVVTVADTTQLRDTWGWIFNSWLPNSGRRERNAPEFERFTAISEAGSPIGPVELWIPLEPSPLSSF